MMMYVGTCTIHTYGEGHCIQEGPVHMYILGTDPVEGSE